MDPLTALSLAGTIVQFVDFAGKIIRGSKTLYRSTNGALPANEDLETRTKYLADLAIKLKQPLELHPYPPPEYAASTTPSDNVSPIATHDALRELSGRCASEAENLLIRLEGLKINGKHRVWKSFQHAIKSAWAQREVEEISKRLSEYQRILQAQIMSTLR